MVYYSEPKMKEKKASLDEVDPELLDTFEKLGISLSEQKRLANVAVDAVFDSVSIATTFRAELAQAGVIFCSISEAVREYPDLVSKYLGKVVPVGDNYFAALNSAVFSGRVLLLHPQGHHLPHGAQHLLPHQRHGDWPVLSGRSSSPRTGATSATSR